MADGQYETVKIEREGGVTFLDSIGPRSATP